MKQHTLKGILNNVNVAVLFILLLGLMSITAASTPQVAARQRMPLSPSSLTFYGSTEASGVVGTANKLYSTSGTPATIYKETTIDTNTGWVELLAQGGTGTFYSSIQNPDGKGFNFDPGTLEGEQLVAGNWSGTTTLFLTSGNITATASYRFYKRSGGTGVMTSIGTLSLASSTIDGTTRQYSLPSTSFSAMNFAAKDTAYEDVWLHITANYASTGTTVRLGYLSQDTTNHTGSSNESFVTAGYQSTGNLLHTSGNKIQNEANTNVFLKGVNRFSLEYSCAGDGHFSVTDFNAMKNTWGVNFVRIPLSEVFWLNEGGVNCTNYQATVEDAVSAAEQAGLYVELELHRDAPFVGNSCETDFSNGGSEYALPDSNSETFWQAVAKVYVNDRSMLFGLYNEPNTLPLGDTGWGKWRNGGSYTQPTGSTCAGTQWTAIGMQQLIDNDIHPNAPNIPVIASGMVEYGWEIDWIANALNNGTNDNGGTGYALGTQSSIIYNTHLYSYSDKLAPTFNYIWGYAANVYPVISDEFGQDTPKANPECPYVYQVMRAMDAMGNGYAAWVWTPDTSQVQALLASGDWTGTASTYGTPIKDYYNGSPDSTCLAADATPTITFGTVSASPSPIAAGGTITFQAGLTASNDHAVEVDFKLTDSGGSTIATPSWSALYLTGSTAQTITRKYVLSAGFTSGNTYNVTVIVKGANGGSTIATDTNATTFTVS